MADVFLYTPDGLVELVDPLSMDKSRDLLIRTPRQLPAKLKSSILQY